MATELDPVKVKTCVTVVAILTTFLFCTLRRDKFVGAFLSFLTSSCCALQLVMNLAWAELVAQNALTGPTWCLGLRLLNQFHLWAVGPMILWVVYWICKERITAGRVFFVAAVLANAFLMPLLIDEYNVAGAPGPHTAGEDGRIVRYTFDVSKVFCPACTKYLVTQCVSLLNVSVGLVRCSSCFNEPRYVGEPSDLWVDVKPGGGNAPNITATVLEHFEKSWGVTSAGNAKPMRVLPASTCGAFADTLYFPFSALLQIMGCRAHVLVP